MNSKYLLLIIMLGTIVSLEPRGDSTPPSDIKAVIIGVNPELFHEDTMAMLGNIGFWTGMAALGKSSTAIQKTLFDALKACFGDSEGTYKAYDPSTHAELPKIMIDWLAGTKSPQEINKEVQVAFKNYQFASSSDRDLMLKITATIFSPDKLGSAMKKNNDVYKLIKRIAANSQNTRLLIAANFDTQTFKVLKETKDGREVMSLFKGNKTYISGQEKMLIQDPAFLQKIIQDNDLKPHECLVINNEPHVIEVARTLKMHAHHLNHVSDLKSYLKRHHLIH